MSLLSQDVDLFNRSTKQMPGRMVGEHETHPLRFSTYFAIFKYVHPDFCRLSGDVRFDFRRENQNVDPVSSASGRASCNK